SRLTGTVVPFASPGNRAALRPLSPLRTGLESLPSSRTGLLPSSPLRTVRESFQSHSSGPANAFLKETRLSLPHRGAIRTYPVPLRRHDRLGLPCTPAAC